ncbi:hypothetical protein [Acidithiobacillus sp.]|uniref:hypothetical protein n=1 Tax=Acidithiobacillus sp. TaxID=1872118 RepID=UPI003CFEA9FC
MRNGYCGTQNVTAAAHNESPHASNSPSHGQRVINNDVARPTVHETIESWMHNQAMIGTGIGVIGPRNLNDPLLHRPAEAVSDRVSKHDRDSIIS